VRWFGGVKLGPGGLARAYGRTATMALEAAPVALLPLGRTYALRFPYHLRQAVERLVTLRGGVTRTASYGVDVAWDVWLPHSGCHGFAEAVVEATAGLVVARETTAD
jgi:putative IMPACT (imprinted ancient) family translation regulator